MDFPGILSGNIARDRYDILEISQKIIFGFATVRDDD